MGRGDFFSIVVILCYSQIPSRFGFLFLFQIYTFSLFVSIRAGV